MGISEQSKKSEKIENNEKKDDTKKQNNPKANSIKSMVGGDGKKKDEKELSKEELKKSNIIEDKNKAKEIIEKPKEAPNKPTGDLKIETKNQIFLQKDLNKWLIMKPRK